MFDLTGRRALVTGASRGIGQAIAEALARAGADVAITARSAGALNETAARIAEAGRKAVPGTLDLSETGSISGAVAKIAEALEGLDILVNNAGYEEVRPSLDVAVGPDRLD